MTDLKELREKEVKDLRKLLEKNRQELAGFKSERAVGSLPDGSQFPKKRTEIARILTVLKEKEILSGLDNQKDAKENS